MAGVPPGWYRDPAGSPSLRWWDGSQWTAYLWPSSGWPAVYWARSVRRATEREARIGRFAAPAIWAFAAANAAVVVLSIALVAMLVSVFRQAIDDLGTNLTPTFPTLQPFGMLQVTIDLLETVETAAAVVLLVWQYRAASLARCLGYPARRSPALGVVSWFLPVVNLWFPYQALARLLASRARGSFDGPSGVARLSRLRCPAVLLGAHRAGIAPRR